ncbi:MAG: hypothetical protein PHF24_04270, partial [Syntrophomonas sp.]|nr:hypothetical protein [Syntrophomonas sp.]
MQNIINDYAKLIGTGDLFHLWQDEYKLRTTLRNVSAAGGSVEIKSREEYYFFKRSLYYNNPANFFIILFKNMHHMPVLNCVLESGPAFKTDFFYYLLTYILEQRPPAPDLLFLINIYQDNLHSFFEEVVDVMDDELCSYLLPRTIKKPLRKVLKARKNRLSEQARGKSEDLLQPVYANNEYPTIFGDKIQIITSAINLLKSEHSDSLDSLLDGAEMLFKAGLLTDCLAVLVELAKCQANKNPLFLFREEAYCQKMQQILRKALPFYSLLVCPGDSYRYALRLYRGLFPGFKPDTASLIYLDIHVIAAANLQGYQQYASYEIAQKA